jgi:hypothetical protein
MSSVARINQRRFIVVGFDVEKCRAMVVGVASNNQQQQTTIFLKINCTDSDHGDYCQSDDGGSNETTLVLF